MSAGKVWQNHGQQNHFLEGVLWGVGEVATPVSFTVETTAPPFCARQRDS